MKTKNEKPILFSTGMVQAILEERKTQTRRICKPIPIYDEDSGHVFIGNVMFDIHDKWDIPMYLKDNARWEIGDILWVRETWQKLLTEEGGFGYTYKANDHPFDRATKWKPSIFMPKEACRIKLLVNNIRVERLQDISEEDVFSEGVQIPTHNGTICWVVSEKDSAINFMPNDQTVWTKELVAKAHYAELWSKINGKGSWNLNPWVWVIEFKKL